MKNKTIEITGMSCSACAGRIEKELSNTPGVKKANVNFAIEKAIVEYDENTVNEAALSGAIEKLGYGVVKEQPADNSKIDIDIEGMSCAACSAKIDKVLNEHEGIRSAAVNLTTEKAR